MTTVHRPPTYPFSELNGLEVDPIFRELRRNEPVARVTMPYGGDAWLVTRYHDAKAAFCDPRFSRAVTVGADVPRVRPVIQASPSIHTMDPPDHTRLQKLVSKAFTPRRIAHLWDRTQQTVDDLLDRLAAAGGTVDLVTGLGQPLPIFVICEMLGVPYADREDFRVWSEEATLTAAAPEKVVEARIKLVSYLSGLIEQRRTAPPSDDLLSVLIRARESSDDFTDFQIASFATSLLVAGHATTVNQINNFVYVLLTHPDQLARLKADPNLLDTAIEELLRFTPLSAVAEFPQVALDDVELGGVTVRAGDALVVELSSINRDEEVFTDPDVLDLGRNPNPHLAFAHGPHHCLGSQLARLELTVAVGTLVRRFLELELAVPVEKLEFIHGQLFRGLRKLPVHL